jgi:hypothetical protein
MSNKLNPESDSSQPLVYQIRIKGHLDRKWRDWFEGLSITLEDNGDTLITGPVVDQAALHGLVKKVRDLGLPLISVNRLDPGQTRSSYDDR